MIIEIEQYPITVKLGHYDFERIAQQDIRVSIWLRVETSDGQMLRDELSATVDYASVLAAIDEKMSGREFKLIETVVAEVGILLMERFPLVSSAKVVAEKTRIPKSIAKNAQVRIIREFFRNGDQ